MDRRHRGPETWHRWPRWKSRCGLWCQEKDRTGETGPRETGREEAALLGEGSDRPGSGSLEEGQTCLLQGEGSGTGC